MGKRKLNIQQKRRITKAQQNHLSVNAQTGLVLCSFGKQAEVEASAGKVITCMIRPNLPTLVAGDKVVWQSVGEESKGVIESIAPRNTVLTRQLKKTGLNKPLAANLSQLVVVIAEEPKVDWTLLDTYLVTAEFLHLNIIIVLNKLDLGPIDIKACLETNYKPLGYQIFYTTNQDNSSFMPLTKQLADNISVVVGQSGVGKSSLISKLIREMPIKTLALSKNKQGQHTTTKARFYHLEKGGGIIDSPGVRGFYPANLTPEIILRGYRELHPFIGKCKFRNCQHNNTQGCAIENALETGHIALFRYLNLIRLLKNNV
ncbi:MAG: ribosome small subunit-dependent GTPase A [Legionellales bacterium RIFCSPHIGHO2_12_FULL_37_14]|nr:MAG: ribosome small subunit-dependent GTPase A [Legionellales bacterium RIFCSPHIGHO2_12_FULL_37_14]